MKKSLVQQTINKALDLFYANDLTLLNRTVCEKAVTHRLAFYLEILIMCDDRWPKPIHIDCEFHRAPEAAPKRKEYQRADGSDTWSYPDIIIHRRMDNEQNGANYVMIEAKTFYSEEDDAADLHKLKTFRQKPKYEYEYGVFIDFERTRKDTKPKYL